MPGPFSQRLRYVRRNICDTIAPPGIQVVPSPRQVPVEVGCNSTTVGADAGLRCLSHSVFFAQERRCFLALKQQRLGCAR